MQAASFRERYNQQQKQIDRGMPQTFFSAPLRYASKKLYQKLACSTQAFLLVKLFLPEPKAKGRKGWGMSALTSSIESEKLLNKFYFFVVLLRMFLLIILYNIHFQK